MSIVEETLNRLKTVETAAPSADGIALPPGLGALPDRRKTGVGRILLWFGLFIIAGAAAWFAADRFASSRPAPAAPVVAGNAPAETAPAQAPVVSAPAQLAESAPQVAATQTSTVEAAKSPSTVAASAPSVPASSAEPASVRPAAVAPAWVAEGRKQLLAGDRQAALSTWNAGFAGLDAATRLAALSSYPDANGALKGLSRLDDFDGAFVAQAAYRGKPAWRILLFADAKTRRADIAEAAGRLGIKGGAYVSVTRLLPDSPTAGKPPLAVAGAAASPPSAAAAPLVPAKAPARDFDEAAAPLLALLDRNDKSALGLAKRLAAEFPERAEPRLWLARAELLAGHPDEAEAVLAETLGGAPHLAEAWLLRGIAAQERDRHDLAQGFLLEARRLAPRHPDVLFNLALSAARVGETARAQAIWNEFLDATAGNARYAQLRAVAQRELGRLPR